MKRSLALIISTTLLAFAGCQEAPTAKKQDSEVAAAETQTLNLYSSRHYDTDLALYDDFTASTGIEINLIEASADALIERIKSEGEFSPADLLITVDAGRLWRAEEAGILAPVTSDILQDRIPAYLRHPDGLWFGLSKRARIIIYNKEAGKPEGLTSYADLASPSLKGKVCMRSSSNIYNISLMASMVSHFGLEGAQDWGQAIVDNFARPPQSNDSGQIEAVASGECGVSFVNTYYIARYAGSDDPAKKAVFDNIGLIFPDQDGNGTHINISGAGLVKTAPNREAAIKFLEYLTSESAQAYLANGNNEYPVVDGVAFNSAVVALGEFKEDNLNAGELGKNQAEAVRVFDRIGWP